MFRINWFSVLVIFICIVFTSLAWAYDLPEVIAEFYPDPEGPYFGASFAWAGDQNGDGIDDLLVSNPPGNRVDLFYGGQNMAEEHDFAFQSFREYNEEINYFLFLGNLLPDQIHCIAISTYQHDISIINIDLYLGGEHIDEDPQFSISSLYRENGQNIWNAFRRRPVDFNGDDYEDFFATREGDPHGRLQIYFGGADFDTVPDWEKTFEGAGRSVRGFQYSTGYDVNSDGYGDMLLRGIGYNEEEEWEMLFYDLFLGGDPMDTIPALHMWNSDFESAAPVGGWVHMDEGFSLLPDVNGDGYDDWGIWWKDRWEQWEDDGFFIFFGGEEPDAEPDLNLEGHRRLWVSEGHLTGGDFNGDGYGDVACALNNVGGPTIGEIHIHFGGRWMDEETDIFIDSEREYNGRYFSLGWRIGATGDYNGDGIDDFVVRSGSDGPRLVIFAGNDGWQVGVEEKKFPKTYNLILKAFPNPFNCNTRLDFTLPQASHTRLAIYDLEGREVEILADKPLPRGNYSRFWAHRTAGVYFIVLKTDSKTEITKIVCLP